MKTFTFQYETSNGYYIIKMSSQHPPSLKFEGLMDIHL